MLDSWEKQPKVSPYFTRKYIRLQNSRVENIKFTRSHVRAVASKDAKMSPKLSFKGNGDEQFTAASNQSYAILFGTGKTQNSSKKFCFHRRVHFKYERLPSMVKCHQVRRMFLKSRKYCPSLTYKISNVNQSNVEPVSKHLRLSQTLRRKVKNGDGLKDKSLYHELSSTLTVEKNCAMHNESSESRKRRDNETKENRSPYFKDNTNYENLSSHGLHETIKYTPPVSPYQLIQEKLYDQPWQLLVATMFLNKTSGKKAIPIFWKFIEKFSTPNSVMEEDWRVIADLIRPLGLHEKRAKRLIQFSREYANKIWKYPIELHGIGKYGNDSYRIFCLGQWRKVYPNDIKLNLYHSWIIEQNRQHNLLE